MLFSLLPGDLPWGQKLEKMWTLPRSFCKRKVVKLDVDEQQENVEEQHENDMFPSHTSNSARFRSSLSTVEKRIEQPTRDRRAAVL